MHHFAYPDTCLLLPLFLEEAGSALAGRVAAEFTRGGELPLLVSELTCLEFNSAVAKHVRTGTITKKHAHLIVDAFERQCAREFIVLPVQSADFSVARGYIARLDTSLRSFDALHLAIAHANKCTLITADKQLAAAAALLDVEHYFVPYA